MKTGDLIRLLGVSETTVRNWISEFDDFFSDDAKGIGRSRRAYTENDILIAQTIAALSAKGHSYAEILDRLRSGERIEQYELTSGINTRLVPESSVRTLVDAAEVKAERDRLQLRVEELEDRIEKMMSEHKEEIKALQKESMETIASLQRESAEIIASLQKEHKGEIAELQRKLGYLEGRLSEIDKKDI